MSQKRIRQKAPKLPAAYVCLGIPSGATWAAQFATSLWGMTIDSLMQLTPGYSHIDLALQNTRGSTLWTQRSKIMQDAVTRGCTHLLFVDSDQTFPPATLRRLLAHKKPVVAANVAVKQIPAFPTARKRPHNGGPPAPIFTTLESKGLEEVWRVGTGIMLIDLSIVQELPQPWFKVSWGDDDDQYGEDWWFCSLVEKAGIPIYIDHDLSWEVGHIGPMEYQHFHVPKELVAESNKLWAEGGLETYSPTEAVEAAIERYAQGVENGT